MELHNSTNHFDKNTDTTAEFDVPPLPPRRLDFVITVDERICDGFYFTSAFHELHKYLKNPELLEIPPEKIVYDIE